MSETPQTIPEWADWYVTHNFGIFPLVPRSKVPAVSRGVNDWTDDPQAVHNYWERNPTANIGIACGQPSGGLLVIDLDVSDAKDGLHTLKEWQRNYGELPETAEAITGSGGRHLLYRTDRNNIHPSTNADLGVDIRSGGSYIVAPPSIHPNGEPYEWWASPLDVGIAMADGRVYDFLDHVQRNGGRDELKKDNGKFKLPEHIRKGERDNVLFKYAAHLRALGRSDEEILASVAGINSMRCEPPMDSLEVKRIVKSACRYDRGSDGGALSDRPINKFGAGAATSKVAPEDIFTEKGKLITNKCGALMIERDHARIIDGAPAIWTGRRWEFGTEAMRRTVLAYADGSKKAEREEVVDYVIHKAPKVVSDREFNGGYYVQFSNATYDIMADQVVEPTPEMLIVGTLPFDLDIDAPVGLADQFLDSIAAGDHETRRVLEEIIGLCICSSHIVSKSPMLVGRANGGTGKAANGKSTFINWLGSIAGSENVCSLSIADMDNRFNKGMVVGKLANLGDDMPDGYLKGDQLATFKKMVTGDAIFTDVKGGRGYTFRPFATQVFSMNTIPRMSDTTEGIYRRLAFIPFRAHFAPGEPGFDPTIGRKLSSVENLQRGALLGLMRLRDLIERGDLTHLPDMDAEIDQARADNSSVARYITEKGITTLGLEGEWVESVYNKYRSWCRDSGEQFPKQKSVFSRELIDYLATTEDCGYVLTTPREQVRGNRGRVYHAERV